jgi:hypothetical protein
LEVSIEGVGKLSIPPGCKGYSVSAILYTHNERTSNGTLRGGDLMSQAPLSNDCCKELGATFNISQLSLEIPHKNIISHMEDLRYTSRKICEIEAEIK